MRVAARALLAPLIAAIAPRAGADTVIADGGFHHGQPQSDPLTIEPARPAIPRDYRLASVVAGPAQFWADRDELRAELARNGFAQPDNVSLAAGFALAFAFDGVRGEFGGALGGESLASQVSETKLRSYFLWLDFGYELWRSAHTSFFPLVGIGGDEVHLTFDARRAPILPEQMSGVEGELEIWRSVWQVRGGLGFEHLFVFEETYKNDRISIAGMVVGARLGYRAPFSDGSWGDNERDFSGGPRLGAAGPFVLVAVGLGAGSWSPGTCQERCGIRPRPGTALTCDVSRCLLVCEPGFGDCDGDASNGCETVLETTRNCGGCGVRCAVKHGFPTCAEGVCAVASCHPGFMDCDGQRNNGCEARIEQDERNCGGCTRICRAGQRCSAGVCI